MPIHGYPGNVITANPTAPTSSVATGVWTTEQQLIAKAAGNWPTTIPTQQISRSLRFNNADSANLTFTPSSAATSSQKFTLSFWVKRTNLGTDAGYIYGNGITSGAADAIGFNSSDQLNFEINGTNSGQLVTTQVFRDASSWYHIVYSVDTTQATASNRIKVYVNGVQITAFGTASYPSQNYNFVRFNQNTYIQYIGFIRGGASSIYYLSAYLTEIYNIDGQALTPSSFGQTNASTGVWEPIAYSGTYGTNGFYVNFSDNSNTTAATLGKDYSGNGNNFTPNNFSVTAGAGNDSMVDTPTSYGTDTGVGGEVRGNYCTWNRLQTSSSITLNNGNLDGTISGGFLIYSCAGTIEVTTSKWYYETVVTAGHSTAYPIVGVCDLSQVTSGINTSFYSSTGSGNTTGIIAHATGTTVYLSNNTSTTDGVSYNKTTDVLMIAFDADLGKVWFGKNGTWNNSSNPATNTGGHTFSTVSGKGYRPYVQCNADTSNSWTSNFGQRAFAYTAPSGFKALCTQNLPTPTIGATSTTQANDYFDALLWTGNGTTQNITTANFQPDWLWVKERSEARSNLVWDAVRGSNLGLLTNSTNAESSQPSFTGFLSNGFGVSNTDASDITNKNAQTYVGWIWKANGAGSSNTAGTITSTVSANTTAGFSISTYTGNGSSSQTVGHGLGVAPGMVIIKTRSNSDNWRVWHTSLTSGQTLTLNSNAAQAASGFWPSNPSTSVVYLGTDSSVNSSTWTYVMYSFASVAGYSAFGSYTGNGSSDGPFIFTNFRPKYVMVKCSSSTGYWIVEDSSRSTTNPVDAELFPNDSLAEYDGNRYVDFLSNGFKIRHSDSTQNGSGLTYIYAAFAESPFKYALAR